MCWGGNFVVGRMIHANIPPFTLAFFRWLLVVVLLFPISISGLKKYQSHIKDNVANLIALSILSIVIYTSFVYWGVQTTTAVNASLINASAPVLILVLAVAVLKEHLSACKLSGIVLSFLGVIYVVTQGHIAQVLEMKFTLGDLLILIAAIAWAVFSILTKKMSFNLPPLLFLFITAVIGVLILLPLSLWEWYHRLTIVWQWQTVGSIFYAGVFASILAFSFWNIGVRTVGPAIAAYFFNLLPVFSSLLAIGFLGEKIHTYHVIGFVLVLSGILLATLPVYNLKQKLFSYVRRKMYA